MEPQLQLSSLGSADGKKKARYSTRDLQTAQKPTVWITRGLKLYNDLTPFCFVNFV